MASKLQGVDMESLRLRLLTEILCVLWLSHSVLSNGQHVTVQCNKNDMTVYLRRDFLSDFYLEDLRLRDTGCFFPKKQNRTHFILTVPLTGCGTRSKHTNESLIYTNLVRQREIEQNVFINRMPIIEIPIRCTYSKKIEATYVDVKAKKERLDLRVKHGSGEFTLKMTLFLDAAYKSPVTADKFPLTVTINQRLFFQLAVDSQDKGLSIIAERCYATPTRIPTKENQYDIIANRCPRDATLKIHSSKPGTQRFSFQSFQFVRSKGPPYVFIHCEVRVCDGENKDSKCARGCVDEAFVERRIRRESEDEVYDLEKGPLIVTVVERPKQEELNRDQGDTNGAWMPWVLTAMGVVCIVCVVVVGYTRRELYKIATEERSKWENIYRNPAS